MRSAIAVITAALALLAGCARGTSGGAPPAGVNEAEVYLVVLRRYLTQPSENSFPERTFKIVYVMDQAFAGAGEPATGKLKGIPIAAQTQSLIVADLTTMGEVKFVSDKGSVLENSGGCAKVKNDGILISLGTIDGDKKEVKVGINGYVACLGATWLTYVVENPTGTGWIVKGPAGPITIS